MDEPMITSDGAVDAELVSSYLAGDRSALGSIYDRYGQSLFDTATAMTNNRDDASDMVQDVFVLAAERLGQLRDPSRLKPWLFAILRNEVYRRSRRRSRQAITDFSAPEHDAMLPSTPSSSDAVDDALEGAELAEFVRAAASGLDARDQLVLELSVRQGLSGDDLADALGVSAQQSYGLVHRMRERTERSLGAYCVARRGRKECDELDAILRGWSGDFTVLLRKRVSRHIDACNICERSRRRFAPLALVGAAPAFAAPIGLRSSILDRVALLHPDISTGVGGDGSTSSQATTASPPTSTSSAFRNGPGAQAKFG
ncbi:MAG: sigma-70 family RNA polymerase sigma factor, partial [Actinomycetota bacterium]|nr:sigma-70 family RNA polymerase sigma factor [Actinomycetota bacterium]